jgi:hypothetical protein
MLNYSSSSLCYLGTARADNVSSNIACSLVAGRPCSQSCSLTTVVVVSPEYIAVSWKWVYMPQYYNNIPARGRTFQRVTRNKRTMPGLSAALCDEGCNASAVWLLRIQEVIYVLWRSFNLQQPSTAYKMKLNNLRAIGYTFTDYNIRI